MIGLLAERSPSCRLPRAARAFATGQLGAMSIEAAIILPVLCLLYVSAFVWFDAFRMQNLNLKATYTLADLISREPEGIDQAYFDGLDAIYDYLTPGDHPTGLRVSIIECTANCDDDATRELDVCWSHMTAGQTGLTTAELRARNDAIPLFANGDELIVTETFMSYTPVFDVGIGHQDFENTVYMAPRLAGQMKFLSSPGPQNCYNNP